MTMSPPSPREPFHARALQTIARALVALRRWHRSWVAMRTARYQYLAQILDPPPPAPPAVCCARTRGRREGE
jgi:hypothetical protein